MRLAYTSLKYVVCVKPMIGGANYLDLRNNASYTDLFQTHVILGQFSSFFDQIKFYYFLITVIWVFVFCMGVITIQQLSMYIAVQAYTYSPYRLITE